MNFPRIHKSVFVDEADAAINSDVLRAIFESVTMSYDPKDDVFFSNPDEWGVSIEDIHDDEENPHYILTVGTEQFEKLPVQSYVVRYCDYHSVQAESLKAESHFILSESHIDVDPGRYYIRIWLPEDYRNIWNRIAGKVEKAYYDAMVKYLPDYAILTSRPMYSKTPG